MKNIIKTRTLFGAGLTALAFSSIFTSTAFAQTCAVVPTCEDLGYDLSASDCADKKALKCPFDNTKYFCNVSTTNCTSSHTLTSCPENAVCSTCELNGKYKQTDCAPGYGIDADGKCTVPCSPCDDGYLYADYPSMRCATNLATSSTTLFVHYQIFCIKTSGRLEIVDSGKEFSLQVYSRELECENAQLNDLRSLLKKYIMEMRNRNQCVRYVMSRFLEP